MNTKRRLISGRFILSAAATLLMTPPAVMAQGPAASLPVEMNMLTFLILGSLLLFSIVFTFRYKSRFNAADAELQDLTVELELTRQRYTDTSQSLEKTEASLKQTTKRYQSMLFDAQVGIFQFDPEGRCTYINSALQEMSGLYLKKAQKSGIEEAVHPDDREAYRAAWTAYAEKNVPFNLPFRFRHSNGRIVHVTCRVNRAYNEQKKLDSYIGWVSDTTVLHEANEQAHAVSSRYVRFIEEAVEGYYHLAPESPVPLTESEDRMAAAIMEKCRLVACNETFAALYGEAPEALAGRTIAALQDGCGPLKNRDTVKKLVKANFRLIHMESVRQDPRGNRINLINQVIGIVEDDCLVGILGAQRNVTAEKREKAELVSQADFMHRILDALPADVHVKDTRCRYLYASRKLAARTGIPQKDWIGKTIFEVLPATPRDHDKQAVEVMKSGKLNRVERAYETRSKSGWMETLQIPLVSEDGLIEGVVGLSIETSERKKKEEQLLSSRKQLELELQRRTAELNQSRDEHGKAVTALRTATQELRIRETEIENQRTEFEAQLNERRHAEDKLRRNEESLLTRQQQLKEQLDSRLNELNAESDKRRKWEELLVIKETELRKVEEVADTRTRQLEKEIAQRQQAEEQLEAGRAQLEQYQDELQSVESRYRLEIANLSQQHQREFGQEQLARKAAEQHLRKTRASLQETTDRIQALIDKHATELEHEVAERKTASAKLIQHAEELDELKRRFHERLEEETKALKKELAQKQINEKALRQQSNDLESRIRELEKTLQMKSQEANRQVQAREGAEVERQQMEQQLERLTAQQQQIVERQTQKLNLQIAEIKLEEIKLRKEVGDLELERETLHKQAREREADLRRTAGDREQLAADLQAMQQKMREIESAQQELVAKETRALHDELRQLKQSEADLRRQEQVMMKRSGELEQIIEKLKADIRTESETRRAVEDKLKELGIAYQSSQENVGALIKEKTAGLEEQVKLHRKNEEALKKAESAMQQEAEHLRQTIDARTQELAQARLDREKAEKELEAVVERARKSAGEVEARIHAIREEQEAEIHRIQEEQTAEIQRIRDEQKELRQKEKYYRSLIQASADAFLQIDLKSGRIQSANQAAAALFGEQSGKALEGKSIDALSPADQPGGHRSVDLAKARLHSALETGHESFEWTFGTDKAAAFHGLVSLSSIQIDQQQLMLAVISDISELKQQQFDLQQALAEAHAANEMNSRIVDELTENVETTLTPVLSSAATIGMVENFNEEQKQALNLINLNCRTLIDTMHYRSELSHMADGTDELQSAKCDLHGLIKALDEQFSHRAETKKLFFALSYAQYQSANNVPKFVETDEHKVRTVLGILLGYAMAQTERGRMGLHAARKSNEGDTVCVSFELTYTGRQQRDERLSRALDPESTGVEEMEYGLTLARRYIRMLDGDIKLEYRKSDITAVTINLPFKKAASEIVMPDRKAEQEAGAA